MKNELLKSSAFTLIELLVVMTIFFAVFLGTYTNYSYSQNKAKLKQGIREVTQTLTEVKNLAKNGHEVKNESNELVNASLGVFFDNSDAGKNLLKIYAFPYTETDILLSNGTLFKEKKLPDGVEIDNIIFEPVAYPSVGQDKALFFYPAINPESGKYYGNNETEKNTENTIEIHISLKNSTAIKEELKYDIRSGIVDY